MAERTWTVGAEAGGFTVTGVTPLPELNLTLIQLKHRPTGARMAHLAADDDNNLFGVGFRTTPRDSTGVAHILEHTVLCGSKRFPVRDPFFSMIKRSLNTFMNALTSSDWTFYPFSTQNRRDFDNLMDVYLDAVFFPLLRERDFRQEGHRIEFAEPGNPDSPLQFKGVVYNEMKGAMADPSSLLGRRMTGALYPTTTYGVNSGGEPSEILDLTWEQLRAFHAEFYHPANAWLFTYGNFPLEEHLARIEEKALRHFGPKEVDTAVPDERRFTAPQRVEEVFPIEPGDPLERRTMVQVGWLACPVADSFERLALAVLSHLLLGHPAAPLYKALLDSRLGQNLAPGTGYRDDNRETYFAAGLQGTEPEQAEAIEQIVLQTLEKCAREGFSRERVETAIHQIEFGHREVIGDQYPYPLILLMRILGPWLHNDDPLSPLELERNLGRLRRELDSGSFFENLLRRRLLDNPHRVTLTLRPDPERRGEEERETAARLESLRAALTEEKRRLILAQAEELRRAQEEEEDLSVLPTLALADIPATEREVPFDRAEAAVRPVFWLPQPTNGIGYFNASLAADDLPPSLRPYVPLFCTILTQVGAAGRSYEEMAERVAAVTGGIRAGTSILDDPRALDRYDATVEIKGKALTRNQEPMFGILTDYFGAPDFTDLERLYTVIGQVKTSLENSIPGSGHSYAARSASARLTPAARQREEWGGLRYIRLAKEIAKKRPEDLGEVAARFRELAAALLSRGRVRCAVTAEGPAFPSIRPPLEGFLGTLPERAAGGTAGGGSRGDSRRGVGWAASVPVSYVTRVFRTVPFTDPDAAPLTVLARLLRSGFLHREIREKGGAYGGMANFDAENGLFSMLSYRDPHLVRTLRVYRQAAEWAAAGSFDQEALKEAVLAVFSSLDRPLSPGGRGYREFASQLQGLTREMRQELRQRILAVDRPALMGAADRYLLQGWADSAVAVVSSEEILRKANEELGEEGLEIERV